MKQVRYFNNCAGLGQMTFELKAALARYCKASVGAF